MKRLILDHYRRWSRVLALVAAVEFALGWLIATGPDYTFEFWALLLVMWTGANLLSFDLKRGALRAVAVLPLTGRQIGWSWWLATVPIPAITLSALLFSGAATFCHFHPARAYPAEPLMMASLFNLVWLGIMFTMIFNATRGFGRSGWEFFGNAFISLLSVVTFFGSMLLCQGASKDPFKAAILLGLGGLLTAVGWVRAEQFEPGRAGLYLGRIEPPNLRRVGSRMTPLEPRIPPGEYCAFPGRGGVPFLLSTTFVRALSYITAMVALIALLWRWQSHRLAQPMDFVLVATIGGFMSCWFIVFYQSMPTLRHLRFLRTLPVSSTRLAAAMIASAILPLIALGALLAAVAWLVSGPTAALALLNSYTFTLAPAALCVSFAVWRGAGIQAYALFLFVLLGSLLGSQWLEVGFPHPKHPVAPPAIAALCVLLAFVLTRQALMRSRHPYRVQADASGSLPWGMSQ